MNGKRNGGSDKSADGNGAEAITPVMNGRLDEVSLPELVQMFANGRHAVQIEIRGDDGRRGFVVIRDGGVAECHYRELLGDDAFFALCRVGGQFYVKRSSLERLRPSVVSRGWQELLLEAAKREDEGPEDSRVLRFPERQSSNPPSARETWRPQTDSQPINPPVAPSLDRNTPMLTPEDLEAQEAEPGFDSLFAEATRAYLVRDLALALELFEQCQRVRPGDRRVLANIERLSKLVGREEP